MLRSLKKTLKLLEMFVLFRLTDKRRMIELKIAQASGKAVERPLPIGLQMERRVDASDWFRCVSHHNGQLFAGMDGGVDVVYRHLDFYSVIEFEGSADAMFFNGNGVLVLVHVGGQWHVRTYDPEYQLLMSWQHDDSGQTLNELVVVGDVILLPDRGRQTIARYKLSGESETSFPCPMLRRHDETRMCVMSDGDSVVVVSGNTVCCLNAMDGQPIWSNQELDQPLAVTCDSAGRVFVAVGGRSPTIKLVILDGCTGEMFGFVSVYCSDPDSGYLPKYRVRYQRDRVFKGIEGMSIEKQG